MEEKSSRDRSLNVTQSQRNSDTRIFLLPNYSPKHRVSGGDIVGTSGKRGFIQIVNCFKG